MAFIWQQLYYLYCMIFVLLNNPLHYMMLITICLPARISQILSKACIYNPDTCCLWSGRVVSRSAFYGSSFTLPFLMRFWCEVCRFEIGKTIHLSHFLSWCTFHISVLMFSFRAFTALLFLLPPAAFPLSHVGMSLYVSFYQIVSCKIYPCFFISCLIREVCKFLTDFWPSFFYSLLHIVHVALWFAL